MGSVIYIEAEDVGTAWLEALSRVLEEGDEIETEYDQKNSRLSRDSTALIKIKYPFKNPIKKRFGSQSVIKITTKFGNTFEVYGSIADVFLIGSIQAGYIEEILYGVNDHYIKDSDRSFPYSYHDRIFNYKPYSIEDTIKMEYNIEVINNEEIKTHQKLRYNNKVIEKDGKLLWILSDGTKFELDKEISEQINLKRIPLGILEFPKINQIKLIIEKLKKTPHTRRAQAITWRPYSDPFNEDPPCLQRLYFRIKENKLILQTCWRSRDLFKAWEANVNGMIRIQKMVADELGLEVGEYVDFSNSLHIYGQDIEHVKSILEQAKKSSE